MLILQQENSSEGITRPQAVSMAEWHDSISPAVLLVSNNQLLG